MAHSFLLGVHVERIVLLDRNLDRDSFLNGQAQTVQTVDLAGIIGQKPQLPDAEVPQDLGAHPVFAQVRGKPASCSS